MKEFVDWLGQTVREGDTILWPAASGRSINMCRGTVKEIKDNGNVVVTPDGSSRWQHHPEVTYYIDNRTGKRIWAYDHVEKSAHYVDADGNESWYNDRLSPVPLTRVPTKFNDYVEKVVAPHPPVILKVVKNITLFEVANV